MIDRLASFLLPLLAFNHAEAPAKTSPQVATAQAERKCQAAHRHGETARRPVQSASVREKDVRGIEILHFGP